MERRKRRYQLVVDARATGAAAAADEETAGIVGVEVDGVEGIVELKGSRGKGRGHDGSTTPGGARRWGIGAAKERKGAKGIFRGWMMADGEEEEPEDEDEGEDRMRARVRIQGREDAGEEEDGVGRDRVA